VLVAAAASRSSSLRLDILDTVPQHPDKLGLGLPDVELAFELRRVAADNVAMRPRARMAFPVFCYLKTITHTQNMQFKIHTKTHMHYLLKCNAFFTNTIYFISTMNIGLQCKKCVIPRNVRNKLFLASDLLVD
jgi:hypothetical protein